MSLSFTNTSRNSSRRDNSNFTKSSFNNKNNDSISSSTSSLNSRYKRNKSDSENDNDTNEHENDINNSKTRSLRSTEPASPLKRFNRFSQNENETSEESPKKRLKIPNFDSQNHVKRFNLNNNTKASVSLCLENEQRKFASTPKSERKTSSTASRLKHLNNSEDITRNLSNNWADIIEELEQQSKELNEYTEKVTVKYKLDKDLLLKQIETDAETLRKRQKQINFGKVTAEYQRYVLAVSKKKREQYHPRTPNKFRKCSRRKFDGLIKKWRKLLHVWDENPDALQDLKYSMENEDEDEKEYDFGGCSGISYNIDDYDVIDYNEEDYDACGLGVSQDKHDKENTD